MQIDADILINEHQTGEKLSQAVHEARRADFGMILAMMSQNVLDHAAFALPTEDEGDPDSSTAALRAKFQVDKPQPFAANDASMIEQAFTHSQLVHSAGITSQKLSHHLNPAPLAQFDDVKRIPDDVFGNCEPAVQQRIQLNHPRVASDTSADPLLLVDFMDKLALATA